MCAVWEDTALGSATELVANICRTQRLGLTVPTFQFLIDGPVAEP
jgi:hypothetical protein